MQLLILICRRLLNLQLANSYNKLKNIKKSVLHVASYQYTGYKHVAMPNKITLQSVYVTVFVKTVPIGTTIEIHFMA